MSKDEFEAADVFILHKHIEHGYCVVLFQDAKRRTRDHVTMPGGMWDKKHSDLPEVAKAELFEESLKSIKADLAIFKTMDASNMFVDIRGIHRGNKQRRVYFCYMPYIETQKYYNNKSLLKDASREYRETEHIIFIPIKDIINSIIKIHNRSKEMHETKIMDVTERSVKVHKITMNALYTFLNEKNLLDQLLSLNQSLSAGGGLNFFNNWRRWLPRAPRTPKVSITTGSPVLPLSTHIPQVSIEHIEANIPLDHVNNQVPIEHIEAIIPVEHNEPQVPVEHIEAIIPVEHNEPQVPVEHIESQVPLGHVNLLNPLILLIPFLML